MKKAPEQSDSSRKKLVGEYLRNADKLLKVGELEQALMEVEKSLELEPGNFYAQAYKERINALREKHGRTGELRPTPPASGQAVTPPAAPPQAAPVPSAPEEIPEPPPTAAQPAAGDEGPAETGAAQIEETAAPETETPAGTDIAGLRDQLERERASQESETHRRAEEIARTALEQELRERKEEGRRKEAGERALVEASAEGRAQARIGTALRAKETFAGRLAGGDIEGAFAELARIRIVDPADSDLPGLEEQLNSATIAAMRVPAGDVQPLPREIALQWYGRMLRSAWGEGQPNRAQADALGAARQRFNVTEEEERSLLAGIQREIVEHAVKEAYAKGEPDPETRSFLETLGRELSVGDIDSLRPKPTK